METVKKKEKLHSYAIATVVIAAFGWLFLMGNYGTGRDSASYLTMGITREPLYPILLRIMQMLFGEESFFIPLAVFQNALGCVSVLCVANYFGKKIFRHPLGHWISALALTMPFLMTPIFSRSHLVLTNTVMAEGITLAGYYFFVWFLLKLIYEEDAFYRNMLIATGISLLLILARGQLLLTVIVLGIVLCIRLFIRKEYKKLYIPVLVMLVLFASNSLLTKAYHLVNNGVFVATASSKPMILANVLYVSQPSDGDAIEDPQLKELFTRTYEALDKEGMLYSYAGGGMIDKALHHESCHDSISFYYFEPIKNEVYYPNQKGDPRNVEEEFKDAGYVSYMLEQDRIASALTKELLAVNLSRYLSNYVNVCMLGLVRSVAISHPILNIYALCVYLGGLILLGYAWKKNGLTPDVVFFGMTYIMIAGFATATSLFLQCITRYMIYNLPFFYIAAAVLLYRVFEQKSKVARE